MVTDYVASLKVTDITYVLNTPTFTGGNYIFDEQPFCGYTETVALTNLPVFVTHNLATSDFTVPATNDLSLIGSYVVNIKSSISVPTDWTQSSFLIFFADYDFTVYIEPCVVNDYVATL